MGKIRKMSAGPCTEVVKDMDGYMEYQGKLEILQIAVLLRLAKRLIGALKISGDSLSLIFIKQ